MPNKSSGLKPSKKLKKILSDGDFEIIERITNKQKEKEYIKQRNKNTKNLTKGKKTQIIKDNKSLLKPAVLNLINQEISQHYIELLNFGPKFISSNKKLPFMDIATSTEIFALNLEKENQTKNAELLHQQINKIVSKV